MFLSLSLPFFFNDTATTEIYTLSLHDALPISEHGVPGEQDAVRGQQQAHRVGRMTGRRHHPQLASGDRKSTRLNSSHVEISYAVFCLKKKKYFLLELLCP